MAGRSPAAFVKVPAVGEVPTRDEFNRLQDRLNETLRLVTSNPVFQAQDFRHSQTVGNDAGQTPTFAVQYRLPTTQEWIDVATFTAGGLTGSTTLPTGASTSANQTTEIDYLADIDTNTTTLVEDSAKIREMAERLNLALTNMRGRDFGVPVYALQLPLPSGAATEKTLAVLAAQQAVANALLATLTTPSQTQPVSAASLPLPSGAATDATFRRQAEMSYLTQLDQQRELYCTSRSRESVPAQFLNRGLR